jgi:hypothetical protein
MDKTPVKNPALSSFIDPNSTIDTGNRLSSANFNRGLNSTRNIYKNSNSSNQQQSFFKEKMSISDRLRGTSNSSDKKIQLKKYIPETTTTTQFTSQSKPDSARRSH